MRFDNIHSTPMNDSEEQRGLQQTDAEIGHQLSQMLRIGMHTLVWIHADPTCIGKPECAQRFQPFLEQIVHQALPQDDARGLIEPGLRDVQKEQDACQLGEDTELLPRKPNISLRVSAS